MKINNLIWPMFNINNLILKIPNINISIEKNLPSPPQIQMVVPLYKSNKFWVFRTQLNCPFFCLFVLLSITPHLTAQ